MMRHYAGKPSHSLQESTKTRNIQCHSSICRQSYEFKIAFKIRCYMSITSRYMLLVLGQLSLVAYLCGVLPGLPQLTITFLSGTLLVSIFFHSAIRTRRKVRISYFTQCSKINITHSLRTIHSSSGKK